MNTLKSLRASKDEFFRHDPQSPLTHEQKHVFKGLRYFPENPDLRVDITVEEYPKKETIEIQTSTGDTQEYERFGCFHFRIEGQPVTLTIYTNDTGYFLPFVDSLAGKETYPAGRYLEPKPLGNNRFLIDFNLAYNPYCAYNDMWSCPLTPFENRVKVPVRAGEKIFKNQ